MWINWSRMVRQCSELQLRYRESSTATTHTVKWVTIQMATCLSNLRHVEKEEDLKKEVEAEGVVGKVYII
jgi:hypothetical protein